MSLLADNAPLSAPGRDLRRVEGTVSTTLYWAGTETPASDWSSAVVAIKDLAMLGDGWDGDVAERISSAAIEVGLDLVEHLHVLPKVAAVVPLPDGGLQLEWVSQVGRLTIDIERPGDVFITYGPRGGPYRSEPLHRVAYGLDELYDDLVGDH